MNGYNGGRFFLIDNILFDLKWILAVDAGLEAISLLLWRLVALDKEPLLVCKIQDDVVCSTEGRNKFENELSLAFVSFYIIKTISFLFQYSLNLHILYFYLVHISHTSHLRYS